MTRPSSHDARFSTTTTTTFPKLPSSGVYRSVITPAANSFEHASANAEAAAAAAADSYLCSPPPQNYRHPPPRRGDFSLGLEHLPNFRHILRRELYKAIFRDVCEYMLVLLLLTPWGVAEVVGEVQREGEEERRICTFGECVVARGWG